MARPGFSPLPPILLPALHPFLLLLRPFLGPLRPGQFCPTPFPFGGGDGGEAGEDDGASDHRQRETDVALGRAGGRKGAGGFLLLPPLLQSLAALGPKLLPGFKLE